MKKILVFLAGVLMLTSCGSTESGMFTGAAFGSVIGSCIGGISGGPYGSNVGTLVGMATGAAVGAAVGHENEMQEREYYAQRAQYNSQTRTGYVRKYDYDRSYHTNASNYSSYQASRPTDNESGYSSDAVYNDVITLQPATAANAYTANDTTISIDQLQQGVQRYTSQYPVTIENVQFINEENTQHIAKGELVKISFEIKNCSPNTVYSLVPTVQETTKNKRLMISPSTMIESIQRGAVLRYTAYISAQRNLKTGTAHFVVSITSNNAVVSNVVEFDIPLN